MSLTQTPTSVPTGTWAVDPVHSTVGFELPYMAGVFRGTFREIDARLVADGEGARLQGTARVASVDVKDENLSAHLQSPEFFDAERHPELRFSADEIHVDGERVSVPGAITIKGVSHPVEVTGTVAGPITDPYGNERLGLNLTAAVDRTAFGLNWNNPLPTGEPALSNEVTIVTDLQLVKAA